jgi:hypothetical protein
MKPKEILSILRKDDARKCNMIWHRYAVGDDHIIRDWPQKEEDFDESDPPLGYIRISPNEAWELYRLGVKALGFTFDPPPLVCLLYKDASI